MGWMVRAKKKVFIPPPPPFYCSSNVRKKEEDQERERERFFRCVVVHSSTVDGENRRDFFVNPMAAPNQQCALNRLPTALQCRNISTDCAYKSAQNLQKNVYAKGAYSN